MHFPTTLFCVTALLSLVAASPVQHGRRYDPTKLTASTTTSSTTACPTTPEEGTYCGFINPEDPCAPQPGGYGPKITPDTVEAFQQYKPFQGMASNATTPSSYTSIFKNLTTASKTSSYIGLYLLETYNTTACAAKCDEIQGCNSFNIYVERDPSLNPCKNDSTAPTVWGYWCPVPSSMTNYKCALWGEGLDISTATNKGQNRGDFEVVISGSNGYVKSGYLNSTSYKTSPNSSHITSTYTGTGSAGAVASWSVWSVCALGFAVFMCL